jgi:hypothetical protein
VVSGFQPLARSVSLSFTSDEMNQLVGMFESWKATMDKHIFNLYVERPFIFKELIKYAGSFVCVCGGGVSDPKFFSSAPLYYYVSHIKLNKLLK